MLFDIVGVVVTDVVVAGVCLIPTPWPYVADAIDNRNGLAEDRSIGFVEWFDWITVGVERQLDGNGGDSGESHEERKYLPAR